MRCRKSLIMVLVLTIALCMTGNLCFAKPITWKLAYGGAPNDPTHESLKTFANSVKEKSNGQFMLKIVLTGPLGYPVPDTLRFLKQGLAESGLIVPAYLTRDEMLFSVLLPHGVILEKEDNLKLIDIVRNTSKPIFDKWGIDMRIPIFVAEMVDWVLIANEPISTLDQLKGKKVRHSDKITIKALNKLGVSAQSVPYTETYMALKTGVIDGAVYGRLYALKQSLYEVTKYASEMGPYSTAVLPAIGVSKQAWAKLPDDMKKAFEEAGKAALWDRNLDKWKNREYEKSAKAELEKKGLKEIDPFQTEDRVKIQKAVLDAWLEECEKIGPEAVKHYNKATSVITIPQ